MLNALYCAAKYVMLAAAFLILPLPGYAQSANGPEDGVNALGALRNTALDSGKVRVIVEMRGNARAAPRSNIQRLVSSNAVVTRTYPGYPIVAMTVNADDLDALASSPMIHRVQEDLRVPAALINTNNVVNTPLMWNQGFDGEGFAVAILDTGVDSNHPFLQDKVIAEACFSNFPNTDINAGSANLCPNGQTTMFGPGAANPNVSNCLNSYGYNICSHGTHVAGIAAGANGLDGANGVARGADIVAIQVFHRSGGNLYATTSDMIAALVWLESFGGTIAGSNLASANLSIGGGSYTESCDGFYFFKQAIDRLLDVGVITAIAAGNNGNTGAVTYPSCISSAVTVASTEDSDIPSYFSNISDLVDLWAPGSSVLSSVIGTQYANYSGTSMAAPHVAGAAAVLEQQGVAGGVAVAAALSTSPVVVCRGANDGDPSRCAPRLDFRGAISDALEISEQYVSELTATTAFVGFNSNICGYGDYSYPGGSFTAPRNGICYNQHGITLGVDTPALTPNTTYRVQLTLTDPDSGSTDNEYIEFTTLGVATNPEISNQYVSQITPTTAFVGFESNICGYGDYSYPGGIFVAPRDGVCYSQHGITLGVDTPTLTPGTTYTVELTLTDPDTGVTDIETITFTTLGSPANPTILSPYTQNITDRSAFVGFTSNICGYGDYRYPGGEFIAPRNNICYTDHGITIGVDTQPLNPGTTYTVQLILTDPQTGSTASETITFTTAGTQLSPQINNPFVKDVTETTAFVGYTSNICGYGDYRYSQDSFIPSRSFGCYREHGITIGRDTQALSPSTSYTIELTLTDPVTGETNVRSVSFSTLDAGNGEETIVVATTDRATSGYGWALFPDGTKQWIDAACRGQLVTNGLPFRIKSWPEISAYPDASAFQSCDDIGNGNPIRGSLAMITTVDKAGAGYAWVTFDDSTKQWVDAACRSRLSSAGVPLTVEAWTAIASITDNALFRSCDAIIDLVGEDGSGGNQPGIMATVDRSTSGYGWVRFADNTKQWVDASCRALLVNDGASTDVLDWNAISAIPDDERARSCQQIRDLF